MDFQGLSQNKVHGANMGPIWGQQDPGGPHVGPMDFVIWGYMNPYPNLKKNIVVYKKIITRSVDNLVYHDRWAARECEHL